MNAPDPCRLHRDLCAALRVLSDRQRAALDEQDFDRLLSVLADKQRIVDRLPAAQSAVRVWKRSRQSLPPADREAGESLIAEAERLLGETAARETAAVVDLTLRRNATREELNVIAAAGHARNAYRDHLAPVTHRSLDVGR